METRQLKAFVAITESSTFTAGARRLNITQAAISMQIHQLEEEIGIQLFTRTARRSMLTEAGERLLPRARKILREHDDTLAEIAELAGKEHGRLRIGSASAMFVSKQLPAILGDLKTKYSNAEITVSSGTSKALDEKILRGEIDIALVSLPVESATIKTDLLMSDEIVAVASPQHRLAGKKFISAATLAGEPLILGERGGNTRRLIDEFFAAANVKPNVIMELSRQDAINKMVGNNMGVGIAGSKTIQREVREKRLVSWLIEGSEIKWELGLARLRGGYFSPIAMDFIKNCEESFEERTRKLKAKSR